MVVRSVMRSLFVNIFEDTLTGQASERRRCEVEVVVIVLSLASIVLKLEVHFFCARLGAYNRPGESDSDPEPQIQGRYNQVIAVAAFS